MLIVIYLAIIVVCIAGMWKAFEKADQPGWSCLIPIYNYYIMTKIGGKPGWWVLVMLIPIVNFIFLIWLTNMISKSYGKDEGFTAGLILLSFVFWPSLGFSNDIKYLGPYGDPEEFKRRQDKDKFDFEK